jgi:hypothetical protein
MSTAATAHHHFSNPLAMAAAVVVIVGGATAIGVAASQSESTSPPTPASPVHGKGTWNGPGARIGTRGFHQSEPVGSTPPLKGGHSMVGQP